MIDLEKIQYYSEFDCYYHCFLSQMEDLIENWKLCVFLTWFHIYFRRSGNFWIQIFSKIRVVIVKTTLCRKIKEYSFRMLYLYIQFQQPRMKKQIWWGDKTSNICVEPKDFLAKIKIFEIAFKQRLLAEFKKRITWEIFLIFRWVSKQNDYFFKTKIAKPDRFYLLQHYLGVQYYLGTLSGDTFNLD